jgi:hypothetical protein
MNIYFNDDSNAAYSTSSESDLDNGADHTLNAVLDDEGKLKVEIVNDSNNNNEDLWIDDFQVTLPRDEYEYKIELTPSLTDSGETLSDLLIKDLPSGTTRVEDSNHNVISDNGNGTYTVSGEPVDGDTVTVYIYSDTQLTSTEIDDIHARVTSNETGGDTAIIEVDESGTATIIDGIIEGLEYTTSSGLHGYTDAEGNFDYIDGDIVTFNLGNITMGSIDMGNIKDDKVFLQDLAGVDRTDVNDEYVENMAVLLQSLDDNSDAYDGIVITQEIRDAFSAEEFDLATISEDELVSIIENTGKDAISEDDAMVHVQDMLEDYAGIDEDSFDERVSDITVSMKNLEDTNEDIVTTVDTRDLTKDITDDAMDDSLGTDVFMITNDMTIDFSNLDNIKIKNIEKIDLTSADVTLDKLSLQDVLELTDEDNTLTILGDSANDTVSMLNEGDNVWSKSGQVVENGHTFDIYTNSGDSTVVLKIEEVITDSIV